MPPLAQDIRSAREAVEHLLDELGLRAFVYTVEQKPEGWLLSVDCALKQGWQTVTLSVDPAELRASLEDIAAREKLRTKWRPHFRACAKRSPGGWEHFDHGADIGVRGRGASRAEAFAQAALALTAVVTDLAAVEARDPIAIECEAPDGELLFAEWLNALVYQMSTRRMLFSRFRVRIRGGRLSGVAWGERVDPARHRPAVEVKGATYTMLRVARENSGWVAQTVVDV